jgi:hypothetical protein
MSLTHPVTVPERQGFDGEPVMKNAIQSHETPAASTISPTDQSSRRRTTVSSRTQGVVLAYLCAFTGASEEDGWRHNQLLSRISL